MDATATATDPFSLSDSDTKAITVAGATGIRTVRASLLENRVIWGSLATPGFDLTQGPTLTLDDFIQAPAGPITLAITFTMLHNAQIIGCRIGKHPQLAGTIPVALWGNTGALLAQTSVTFASDTGGWRGVPFASPVTVFADVEYTLGYLSPGDHYAYSAWVFNAQDTVVHPFLVKTYTEFAGTKADGSGRHQGASITFPNATSDRSPANYYIDPIAQWTDDLPGYTGGKTYYDQWVNGGSSFSFPFGVFFADPENLAAYRALGINTLIAGDGTDAYISAIKSSGMDWWPSIHGGDMTAPVAVQEDTALATRVKGYLLTDEPDLNTPYNPPSTLLSWRNNCRRIDSTRPIALNLSYNPVKNQGFTLQPPGAGALAWNQSWIDYAALCDVLSCDFYSLAASDSFDQNVLASAPNRYGIWAYPPQVKRMAELCEGSQPIWGYVETTSQVPSRPTPTQVERAAWALLIAGAKGIVIFDHRGSDSDVTQDFAAALHDTPMSNMLSALGARLQSLATALYAPEADLVSAYTSSGTLTAAQGGLPAGAPIPIHYSTRVVGGSTYLFVQAIRDGTTTATVTVPGLPSQSWSVVGGGTITSNSSGVLTIPLTTGNYDYRLLTAAAVPAFAAPSNTSAPVITTDGTPETGETISSSSGAWGGYPSPTFAYQWQRDTGGGFANISGATSATYVLAIGDEGHPVRCRVTATNSQGSASANSSSITPSAPAGPATPYADAVMALDPIVYYRLADQTDSSGNGLDLTVLAGTGMTDHASLITAESTNGAKSLDGSTWLGHADNSLLKPTTGISLVAWVIPTSLGAFAIMSKNGHALRMQSNGHFQGHIWEGSGSGADLFFEGATAATLGSAHMVVATYDGTTAKLYVNGVEDATVSFSAAINNTSTEPLMVGGQTGATGWLGAIDEVAMFGAALTAGQVTALYDAATGVGTTWPNASNTGVPAGTTLTTVTGDININTDGEIFENKLVNGTITVNADNVTIRNCKIVIAGDYAIGSFGTNLLVHDCEVDGGNVVGHTGVTDQNYTLQRCNIHGCDNSTWAQLDVLIEDCFIHHEVPYDPVLDPHTDGVQMPDGATGVTIRHNTLYGDFRYPDVAHGGPANDGFGNSAITTGSNMSNITIQDNMLAGGGYTLRLDVATPGTVNIVVTGNRWTNQLEAAAGYPTFYGGYGPVDGGAPDNATTWSDNLYYDGPLAGDPVV
jgi:hypothetical protein